LIASLLFFSAIIPGWRRSSIIDRARILERNPRLGYPIEGRDE